MKTGPFTAALLAALLLGGCQAQLPEMAPPERVSTRNEAPPWAAPGTCWGTDETPAVIETVTEQVMLAPEQSPEAGAQAAGVVYRTDTQQKIVTPRQDMWFEIPCEEQRTPEFTASLQRALKARGHYHGPVTGEMTRRTRAAIRAYQKPQGLDSAMISLAAARQMGLVAVPLSDAPEGEIDELRPPEPEKTVQPDTGTPRTAEKPATQPEDTAKSDVKAKPADPETPEAAENQARQAERKAEAAQKAEAAAQAESTRRAAELKAAQEAERTADRKDPEPLPMSAETY